MHSIFIQQQHKANSTIGKGTIFTNNRYKYCNIISNL